jgi:hypothetical protein
LDFEGFAKKEKIRVQRMSSNIKRSISGEGLGYSQIIGLKK